MKVIGEPRTLEKEIEHKYQKELKELEKETEERLAKIHEWETARTNQIKKSRKTRLETIRETAKRRVMNETRMNARIEYQTKKEAMINKVVANARKDLEKLSQSKEYLAYLKKHLPAIDKYTAYCSSADYKKLFGDKTKIQKDLVGVKIITGETTYDLTLDSLMDSRISEIKMSASKALLGE